MNVLHSMSQHEWPQLKYFKVHKLKYYRSNNHPLSILATRTPAIRTVDISDALCLFDFLCVPQTLPNLTDINGLQNLEHCLNEDPLGFRTQFLPEVRRKIHGIRC